MGQTTTPQHHHHATFISKHRPSILCLEMSFESLKQMVV
jgi:hypothetical protein